MSFRIFSTFGKLSFAYCIPSIPLSHKVDTVVSISSTCGNLSCALCNISNALFALSLAVFNIEFIFPNISESNLSYKSPAILLTSFNITFTFSSFDVSIKFPLASEFFILSISLYN